MTLWEIDQLRKEDRRQKAKYTPTQRQGRIDPNRQIEEIARAAEAKRPDDNRPKAARLRDIRTNRAEEKAANRPREAFNLRPERDEPATVLPFGKTTVQPVDDYSLPDIDSIRRHLAERDKGKDND